MKFKKKSKNKLLILFSAIILLIVLLCFIGIYYAILEPSYYSYRLACNPLGFDEGIKELNNAGYQLSGMYYPQNDSITIICESIEANRHESVHYIQDMQNRTGNCQYPLTMFFSEFEAYFSEYYPNWLYNYLYH